MKIQKPVNIHEAKTHLSKLLERVAEGQEVVIAKAGAEGVYVMGFPGQGVGLALKVEDGNARAWVHVLHAVVRKLGLPVDLRKAADPVLRNHAGLRVGEVRVSL